VGDGVARQFAFVVAGGDHLAVVDDDGADRDVVVGERVACLVEGEAHVLLVEHGGGSGIRTHGSSHFTRFPSVPIRPLSHPSSEPVTRWRRQDRPVRLAGVRLRPARVMVLRRRVR
jgi:hypothetical protein